MTRALDHLAGTVLDLGCGLGNLALEAARRGHRVVAVDFAGWTILTTVAESFPAPRDTRKEFETVIAEKARR